MKFHLYADESCLPGIVDRHGNTIELPLVATAIETRCDCLPRVHLSLRARHVDFVTVGPDGFPQVMFEGDDLVDTLGVSDVRYESENLPGGGEIVLTILVSPGDVEFE